MPRVPGGKAQITARDREILSWIGRHGIVTPDHVARRFFLRADGEVGKRAAYRRLDALISLRLLRRDPTPFWRGPHVLRITSLGAQIGEVGVSPARLVEPELRHALALVDLTEELAAATPGATLRTEREIRTERWHGRQDGRVRPGRGRTPDGELVFADGRAVAIELDLTPKRSKDFERVLRSYRQEHYAAVLWYVVPGAVARVTKLVVDNKCDDFVRIRPWHATDGDAGPQ